MRRGKIGQCFSNAGHIIRRDGVRKPYLRYCEGFLFVDSGWRTWTHHAWIEDTRTSTIYEVTIPARECKRRFSDVADKTFYYRAIVKLSAEDYREACFPCGYETIVLPCKHIGCEDEVHGGGIDDTGASRFIPMNARAAKAGSADCRGADIS